MNRFVMHVFVNADLYTPGMEDGFRRYNEYIQRDAHNYPAEMRSTKHPGYLSMYDYILDDTENNKWVPYIESSPGHLDNIPPGGYVGTDKDGKKFTMKKERFEILYQRVEE